MTDHDEPLERWAARREQRLRPVGERTMTHLTGPTRAPHVDRDAPRLVLEWDGVQWTVLALAADYTEAAKLVWPDAQDQSGCTEHRTGTGTGEPPTRRPLGEGTGRHRRRTQ